MDILWKGEVIGKFIDPEPDMWYLEGKWTSNNSSLAKEFEKLASSFDAKIVMFDWDKGTIIEILERHISTNAVVISLDEEGFLFVRRINK